MDYGDDKNGFIKVSIIMRYGKVVVLKLNYFTIKWMLLS